MTDNEASNTSEITKPHVTALKYLNACGPGLEFADKFNSLSEAIESCNRLEWLLWIARDTRVWNKRQMIKFIFHLLRNEPNKYYDTSWPTDDDRLRQLFADVESWANSDDNHDIPTEIYVEINCESVMFMIDYSKGKWGKSVSVSNKDEWSINEWKKWTKGVEWDYLVQQIIREMKWRTEYKTIVEGLTNSTLEVRYTSKNDEQPLRKEIS